MIPANRGWVVYFEEGHTKPVAAWGDNGTALILDEKRGGLRPARDFSNFVRVAEADTLPAVAAIPGGGWQFEYAEDDGSTSRSPVIGWAVDANGWATPIAADLEGGYGEPEDATNFVRLIPPRPDGSMDLDA